MQNDIYDLIIERKLKVSLHLFTRAELVVKEPDSYFIKAAKAGVECFYIGIESGNDEDLKLYNKRATVSINKEAIDKSQKSWNSCMHRVYMFPIHIVHMTVFFLPMLIFKGCALWSCILFISNKIRNTSAIGLD